MSPCARITGIMCGRYSLACIDDLGARFRIFDPSLGFRSHFNIAPGSTNPVIVSQGREEAVMMQWGLVPHWAKNLMTTNRPINTRAESIAEKAMFRGLVSGQRCLVPASGFFEWKQEGTRKVPFYFHVKDESLFAFAGLYDIWQSPDGTHLATYTIITTAANDLMAQVHDRMPVILAMDDESSWLYRGPLTPGEVHRILAPFPAEAMEAYPVSGRVNNPAADDERVVERLRGL